MNRLKNFLGRESDPIQAEHVDISEATTATPGFQQEEMVREFADDPTPDSEVIESIQDVYFSDMDFDASLHELEKLPEVLTEESLDKYRNNLRRQLQAVSRQLSQKILENQRSYVRELDRVMDLEANLQKATSVCTHGRIRLTHAKTEIAINGLEVLSKNRRKVLLQKLLKSLRFIKTLQETDVRLKELLQESNYASAIQLCLECQQAAVTFHQYNCISELSSNLQEILDQIEEQLDVALSNVCIMFSEKEYSKIHRAYKLLGKTQIAMDQLQMHFVNTINKVAVKTLSQILQNDNRLPEDLSFASLCKSITLEEFTPCLILLCQNFWNIMYSYHLTMKWHEAKASLPDENKELDEMSAVFDTNYIKSKLDQGQARIWQDIQQKIKIFVLSTNFAYFKYDDFIKVLDIINRLITIGEEFSHSKSHALQEPIRAQTVNYFKAYHKSTLDELQMFLENEAWELCPVKKNFTLPDLQEFYFMKSHLLPRTASNPDVSNDTKKGYFENGDFNHAKSPFDAADEETDTSNVSKRDSVYDYEDEDDEDDDIPDELKQDFVDENTGEELPRMNARKRRKSENISENTPIVTNTTLNVLRSFGKYMQMMTVLKPIAFDVVICMSQLFDYYLYSVFIFFSGKSDGVLDLNSVSDEKLKICLARINNNIILKSDSDAEDSLKVPAPNLSPMVNLNDTSCLYGFTHKLIGVESLIFLAKQLRAVYKNLDALIPANKRAFLGQFYSQTVDIAVDLRKPVFRTIAEKTIHYDQILHMMSSVKWDLKEIMSQHSPYVDSLVQEYQILQRKLQTISSSVPVPNDSMLALWENVIILSNRLFVDGYSNVKKCSNEGRALMLLDFQQFLMKIDKITKVKPIPEREYVENYIKAFYLSEAHLEEWLKDHEEYTSKQLKNLVTCGTGSHIGKKMRQKLTGFLEELESKSKSSS